MDSASRRFLKTVLGSTALSCVLGISLDIVTANVAVDYFSVHHPKIVPTENPWLLALAWGVAASWWAGAIAGFVVAAVNLRREQPLEPARILKWMAVACATLWAIMISILIAVMALSSAIPVKIRPATFESDRRLVAVAMAHQFEYVFAAVALLVVAVKTWRAKPNPNGTGS